MKANQLFKIFKKRNSTVVVVFFIDFLPEFQNFVCLLTVQCRYLRNSKSLPPYLKEQVERRTKVGPEPKRHPSAFGCW